MKRLISLIFLLLFYFNLYADNSLSSYKDYRAYSEALELKTQKEVLNEITKLKVEIEELTQVESISSTAAMVLAAALSSIVYGLSYSGLSRFFPDGEAEFQRNLIVGVITSFVPGFSVGILLGVKNDEPHLPLSQTIWTSINRSIKSLSFFVAGTGLTWLALEQLEGGVGNKGFDVAREEFGSEDFKLNADHANIIGLAMIPIHVWLLYKDIIKRRDGLKNDVFDLEYRLEEARAILRKSVAIKKAENRMIRED